MTFVSWPGRKTIAPPLAVLGFRPPLAGRVGLRGEAAHEHVVLAAKQRRVVIVEEPVYRRFRQQLDGSLSDEIVAVSDLGDVFHRTRAGGPEFAAAQNAGEAVNVCVVPELSRQSGF